MENLDELKQKYKELGETIERLEKKPLTWADIKDKPGTCFRSEYDTHDRPHSATRIVVPNGHVTIWKNGFTCLIPNTPLNEIGGRVILQDNYGNDLPPERQVVR